MIVCPHCNHRNPSHAGACQACGGSLEGFAYRACPSCDALNPAQNRFCHRCLTELWAESPALEEVADQGPAAAGSLPGPAATPAEPPRAKEARPLASESSQIERLDTDGGSVATAEPGQGPGPSEGEEGIEEGAHVPAFALPEAQETLLEELTESLPIEPAIALPRRAGARRRPTTAGPAAAAAERDAEVFFQVATEPPSLQEPPGAPATSRTRRLPRVARILLYLAVLAAAAVPLFAGGQTGKWVQPSPEVQALVRSLEGLAPGSTVLVSFDYEPTYAGEMDALALALLRDLASRSVRVVAMSTKIAGVGIADRIYRTLREELPAYGVYGDS